MLSSVPFVCPPGLLEKGRRHPPIPTAVAGAEGRVALESARLAAEAGLIEPTLIGDAQAIAATATDIGWDISDLRVIAAADEAGAARAATALARDGEVAAVMKGHIHTESLMRAVIDRGQGLRTGRRISHVFYMTAPERDGAICITDAAINVSPDVEAKLDIIRNAATLFNALNDGEAKVALLSASEVPSAAVPSSVEAEETARRAADEVPGVVVEGPLAFDLAVSPAAAAIKGFESAVALRRRHVEDVADPPPGAQALVAVDHRAQQGIGVDVSLHHRRHLACARQRGRGPGGAGLVSGGDDAKVGDVPSDVRRGGGNGLRVADERGLDQAGLGG